MTSLDKIVFAMCVVIAIMFIVNAVRFYIHQYKGRFHSYIYSTFFEFYRKYNNGANASISSYLKNQIGVHRIVFNTYLSPEKKPIHDFVTIFTLKGILVCYNVTSVGEITGKDSDKNLIVHRDGRAFRIPGPKEGIEKHVKTLKNKCGTDAPVEVCLFFKPKADFSKVKTSYQKASYKQVVEIINGMNGTLTEDQIIADYNACTSHLYKGEQK